MLDVSDSEDDAPAPPPRIKPKKGARPPAPPDSEDEDLDDEPSPEPSREPAPSPAPTRAAAPAPAAAPADDALDDDDEELDDIDDDDGAAEPEKAAHGEISDDDDDDDHDIVRSISTPPTVSQLPSAVREEEAALSNRPSSPHATDDTEPPPQPPPPRRLRDAVFDEDAVIAKNIVIRERGNKKPFFSPPVDAVVHYPLCDDAGDPLKLFEMTFDTFIEPSTANQQTTRAIASFLTNTVLISRIVILRVNAKSASQAAGRFSPLLPVKLTGIPNDMADLLADKTVLYQLHVGAVSSILKADAGGSFPKSLIPTSKIIEFATINPKLEAAENSAWRVVGSVETKKRPRSRPATEVARKRLGVDTEEGEEEAGDATGGGGMRLCLQATSTLRSDWPARLQLPAWASRVEITYKAFE